MVTAGTIRIRRGLDTCDGSGVVGHERIGLRNVGQREKVVVAAPFVRSWFLRISARMSSRVCPLDDAISAS
jgi:hypothetical protein